MGFFDKIRSGRLFFGKEEPSIVVELLFKGRRYVVEEFDLDFSEEVDFKGEPEGLVIGGSITVTVSDVPDGHINEWIMDSFRKENGEIRFLKNEGKVNEGALLHILFKEAYCTHCQKFINPLGSGILTTLVISPHYLCVDNQEFENRWAI
jgi:hypothetical protein